MGKKYRDDIAMVCHEMMKSGQSVGAVSDAEMKDFEKGIFVSDSPEPVYETESKKNAPSYIPVTV